MKEWPKEGIVDFEDLVDPLREALENGYNLERTNKDKNVPYEGYNIGHDALITCLPPTERLSTESLEYDEERGLDLASVLLCIAVQLGMEQGMRVKTERLLPGLGKIKNRKTQYRLERIQKFLEKVKAETKEEKNELKITLSHIETVLYDMENIQEYLEDIKGDLR